MNKLNITINLGDKNFVLNEPSYDKDVSISEPVKKVTDKPKTIPKSKNALF